MAPVAPTHGPTSLTHLGGMPPVSSAPQFASPSLVQRTQRWIEDNQKILLLGAAVAAAGGIGYYLYNKPSPSGKGKGKGSSKGKTASGDEAGSEGENTGAAGSAGKKKKNKKKKNSGMKEGFLKGEGLDGPLLEEIPEGERKAPQSQSQSQTSNEKDSTALLAGFPSTQAEIEALSETERNSLGASLKDKGNKLYAKKDFESAVICYSKAIEVSVKNDAVFYSNRAACYTNFNPPRYENTVADCDEALKLDKNYVKALKRRAAALENLGRDEEAVRDFTATTIIEKFQDEAAAASVERCLKKLAGSKAKLILETREPKLPSPTFMSAYLGAFRPHPKPALPENPSQGDNTLDLAFGALEAADYAHAVSLVHEAIDQGISTKENEAEAYAMRGTFKFLFGDSAAAKADLEKALDLHPSFVQAWVKIASVHMELGDAATAFGDFEAAIRHNPNDPDIYYHRGQVYFIMQEFDKAVQDYEKSTELDGDFIFTHIQAAVCKYKQGEATKGMAAFRRILRQFPNKSEPSNYYGELLLDQQKFPEAVERFDRAIELDMSKKPRNVLPMVNKALAVFQWKADMGQAAALCREALDIDPDCDVAVATLAQLSLQQGNLDEAAKWFEQSAQLARTEGELINALTYEYATRAQMAFRENYPEYTERLAQQVAAMQ